MTQILRHCALIISIPFFSVACGGGSGGSSGQTADPISFSVIDPATDYTGTRQLAPLSEEYTHEIIEDLIFVGIFFAHREEDMRDIRAHADDFPIDKPRKLEEACEESGTKGAIIDRRQTELLVQYYFNNCIRAGSRTHGEVQQRADLLDEGQMAFSMANLSLGGMTVSGNFVTDHTNSRRVANVLFEADGEALYLENMPLPYSLLGDMPNSSDGLDYSKAPSSTGRIYNSSEGYVDVELGDGVIQWNGPDSVQETDTSAWITPSILRGAGGGSAEFSIGTLSDITGPEFTDNWRSTISIQLKEQSESTPKYFISRFLDWYTWSDTQSNDADPSIDLMESNSDQNSLSRSISANSTMINDRRFLTFKWSLEHQPESSNNAFLNGANSPAVTVSADIAGYYYLKLRTSDGESWSEETFRRVLAGDLNQVEGESVHAQVLTERDSSLADVSGQNVAGFSIQLKSSAMVWNSDVEATSEWSLIEAPEDSTASLSTSTGGQLSFTPDQPGLYTVRLKVFSPSGFVSEADKQLQVKSTDEVKPTAYLANNFNDAGLISANLSFFDRPKFDSNSSLSEISNVAWSLVEVPENSNLAGLSGNSTDLFLPVDFDVPGRYIIGYTPSNSVFTGNYSEGQYFAVDPSNALEKINETELFSLPTGHTYFNEPSTVTADFNGDGLEDILLPISGDTVATRIHLQNSEGGFLAPQDLDLSSYNIKLVDIDDDGATELLKSDWSTNQTRVFGYSAGEIAEERSIPKALQLDKVQMVDINGDGMKDVLNTYYHSPSLTGLSVYLSQTDSSFAERLEPSPSSELITHSDQYSHLGDVIYGVVPQHSGKPLLVAAAPEIAEESTVTLVAYQFDEASQSLKTAFLRRLEFSDKPPTVLTGLIDLDADGKLDLVGFDYSDNTTKVYYDVLAKKPLVSKNVDFRETYIEIRDFDGNGLMDLATRSSTEKKIVLQTSPQDFTSALFWPEQGSSGSAGPEVDMHLSGQSYLSHASIEYSEDWTGYRINISAHSAFTQ